MIAFFVGLAERISYWLLKRGIKQNGIYAPILALRDGTVLDGNRRVRICQELWMTAPVVYIDGQVEGADPYDLQAMHHD